MLGAAIGLDRRYPVYHFLLKAYAEMFDKLVQQRPNQGQNAPLRLEQKALFWIVFFLICLGLGYPPLNRFDPAKVDGTSDVAAYRSIVVGRQPQAASSLMGPYERLAQSENIYRVLVPYVAKPFYWLARGHAGTWDASLLGLLIANAIFTATTACLIVSVGHSLTFDLSAALLGATLYLLNFCVANLYLVGLVDSAEGFFLMVIVWSLLTGHWHLLPIWGVFGVLAKETFVPISGLFAFGWWIGEARRDRLQLSRLAWIAALGATSLISVTIAMSTVAGGLVWPWQLAAFMHSSDGFLMGLWKCLIDHTSWYVFIWLLSLGLVRLSRMPRAWILASVLASCGALTLGAYHNAMGNVARPLFSIAGPILSLSTALFLAGSREATQAHEGTTAGLTSL